MQINLVLFPVYLVFCLFLIGRFRFFRFRGISKELSQLIFAGKCILVFFVFGFYSDAIQPNDSASYLHDAGILFNMLLEEPAAAIRYICFHGSLPPGYMNVEFNVWNGTVFLPFFNDNYTVILLNVLIRFISFGVAGVHLVCMAFIGWIGLCCITRVALPEKDARWYHLFPFLVPQVLIWSSLVMKEPLMIFCLGFLLLGLSQWSKHEKKAWKNIFTGLAGFLLVKTFLLVLLIPATIAFILSHLFRKFSPVWIFLTVPALLIGILKLLSVTSEEFDIPALLAGQQLSMYRFVVYSHANSILHPVLLAPTWLSLLKHIPEAVLYALVQPLPWLYPVRLGWLLFIENSLVLIFFIYGFIKNRHVILYSPKRMMFISGALVILVVAGFVAPVAGTLIRYKMPGVLLLVLGVLPARHHFHHHQRKTVHRVHSHGMSGSAGEQD